MVTELGRQGFHVQGSSQAKELRSERSCAVLKKEI